MSKCDDCNLEVENKNKYLFEGTGRDFVCNACAQRREMCCYLCNQMATVVGGLFSPIYAPQHRVCYRCNESRIKAMELLNRTFYPPPPKPKNQTDTQDLPIINSNELLRNLFRPI